MNFIIKILEKALKMNEPDFDDKGCPIVNITQQQERIIQFCKSERLQVLNKSDTAINKA